MAEVLTLMDIQMGNLIRERSHGKLADQMLMLREQEQRELYRAGAQQVARDVVQNMLCTLRMNVKNEKLSDESFREVAGQIFDRMETELQEIIHKK